MRNIFIGKFLLLSRYPNNMKFIKKKKKGHNVIRVSLSMHLAPRYTQVYTRNLRTQVYVRNLRTRYR